jgi:hypothetical protein
MDESYEIARKEQLVRECYRLRDIPYQKYLNLKPKDQEVLRNHISGSHRASYGQLRSIDEQLRSSDIIMGRTLDLNRSPKELESFYSLTNDEINSYLNKF